MNEKTELLEIVYFINFLNVTFSESSRYSLPESGLKCCSDIEQTTANLPDYGKSG